MNQQSEEQHAKLLINQTLNNNQIQQALVCLINIQNQAPSHLKHLYQDSILLTLQLNQDWDTILKCLKIWKSNTNFMRGFYSRMKARVQEPQLSVILDHQLYYQIQGLILKHILIYGQKPILVVGLPSYIKKQQPIKKTISTPIRSSAIKQKPNNSYNSSNQYNFNRQDCQVIKNNKYKMTPSQNNESFLKKKQNSLTYQNKYKSQNKYNVRESNRDIFSNNTTFQNSTLQSNHFNRPDNNVQRVDKINGIFNPQNRQQNRGYQNSQLKNKNLLIYTDDDQYQQGSQSDISSNYKYLYSLSDSQSQYYHSQLNSSIQNSSIQNSPQPQRINLLQQRNQQPNQQQNQNININANQIANKISQAVIQKLNNSQNPALKDKSVVVVVVPLTVNNTYHIENKDCQFEGDQMIGCIFNRPNQSNSNLNGNQQR